MSDFNRAFAIVWRRENGGDSSKIVATDDPHDPGAYTRGGVSLRYHPELTRAQLDSWDMPQFKDFYRQAYWTPNACDFLPWPVSMIVFDGMVNPSSGNGAQALQMAMGDRYNGYVDGKIGPMTLAGVSRFNPIELACRTCIVRDTNYRKSGNFSTYGTGWLIRLFQNMYDAGAPGG